MPVFIDDDGAEGESGESVPMPCCRTESGVCTLHFSKPLRASICGWKLSVSERACVKRGRRGKRAHLLEAGIVVLHELSL